VYVPTELTLNKPGILSMENMCFQWFSHQTAIILNNSKALVFVTEVALCFLEARSDRLCGLVVTVLGYRSGGPGSIPGTTRFSGKETVVGLERGPLSLVSTTEELLGRKNSGSCQENREYGRRDPSRWPRGTLYPQKLAIISPTRSLGRYSSLADSDHGV
jgi:hypothetical protein